MTETNPNKNTSKKKTNKSPKKADKEKLSIVVEEASNPNMQGLNVPQKLEFFISPEIWNSYSNVRKDSFLKIYDNPNSYFYRNRPPGQPQKKGAWTPEERELFLKRLEYFRDTLHIPTGNWGYFSIPFDGRVGYQCCNFFRHLITDGTISDEKYSLNPDGKLEFISKNNSELTPETKRILDQEAFDYLQECFLKNGDLPIISDTYIDIKTGKSLQIKNKSQTSNSSSHEAQKFVKKIQTIKSIKNDSSDHKKEATTKISQNKSETRSQKKSQKEIPKDSSKDSFKDLSKDQNSPKLESLRSERVKKQNKYQTNSDYSDIDFNSDKYLYTSPKKAPKKNDLEILDDDDFQTQIIKLNASSYRTYRRRLQYESDISLKDSSEKISDNRNNTRISPIHYAPDPITNEPMINPFIDPLAGVVLDISTWELYFSQIIDLPYKIYAISIDNLVQINLKTFMNYMSNIININF